MKWTFLKIKLPVIRGWVSFLPSLSRLSPFSLYLLKYLFHYYIVLAKLLRGRWWCLTFLNALEFFSNFRIFKNIRIWGNLKKIWETWKILVLGKTYQKFESNVLIAWLPRLTYISGFKIIELKCSSTSSIYTKWTEFPTIFLCWNRMFFY